MSWLISSGQLEYMALYYTTQSHASDLVDNNHLTLQKIKKNHHSRTFDLKACLENLALTSRYNLKFNLKFQGAI